MSTMGTPRSRIWPVAGAVILAGMIGIAVVTALFATGQIGGETLKGEIKILESQAARFDP
jgi:hypothetical protein